MTPPAVVEIEIGTQCNLSCTYCPNSIHPRREHRWIAPDLFDSILDQLAEMGFCGRISFHRFNEPLLHPDLEGLVMRVCRALPRARPVLYTNGTGLSDRRHRALTEAGVRQFVVTRHRGAPLLPPRPNQVQLRPEQLRLTNRAGALSALSAPLTIPCHAPMEMLIITTEGEVLQCFEDVWKRRPMGNLKHQRLRHIWRGPAFEDVRKALAHGRRDHFPTLCALCDNRDYPRAGLTEGITCVP